VPSLRSVALGLFLAAMAMPAYAYLDPVTGTFLIQGLIAGIAACLAGIRSIRERIIGFFTSIVSRHKRQD
jgi:hypothetical protein